MPTVSRPHETSSGMQSPLGTIMVSGPGQNASAKLRLRRNRRTQVVNLVKVRDVNDQRVILRTAFREENFFYRLAVQRIRRKAVHGFGRHADDLARSNEFCGGFYRVFVGFRCQKSCFHQFTLPFMVSMVFFFPLW